MSVIVVFLRPLGLRLVGIASEFRSVDSLPVLPDGPHTFELKSDGQLIYAAQFNVKDGVPVRAAK